MNDWSTEFDAWHNSRLNTIDETIAHYENRIWVLTHLRNRLLSELEQIVHLYQALLGQDSFFREDGTDNSRLI